MGDNGQITFRGPHIALALLGGLTAGYAVSAYSPFASLIDAAASPTALATVVNAILVTALSAALAVTTVLPRLSRRAVAGLMSTTLVVSAGVNVAPVGNAPAAWAGSITTGILFACTVSLSPSSRGLIAAVFGWIVAANAGLPLDRLVRPQSDFGWTANDPSDAGPATLRVVVCIVLAILTAVARDCPRFG
ncbi:MULTISPECIES: hypothetical protein [Nocardiaceae]|uniref:Uncharacterized protein n=1 Tax=Rhodococcoides corynebacterioides TaxID=53972 RepID=A0ABS2KV78_9NOCA|nr:MULTISPECIES: hypothetical protein [Rhodococcus]MBM7415839.1 hypothetical protein [Rhodococcus corynebacterioides]MBP1118301.1 hypothetical protein [Rhodococcus sp. PvP016]